MTGGGASVGDEVIQPYSDVVNI